MQNNRTIGTKYEEIAKSYLESKGYTVLECNYRCRQGEIDIIALCQEVLVFVEVKYRKTLRAGHPLDAITWKKKQTISQCANYYMMSHNLTNMAARFDVVGIIGDEITLIENAFEYC